jgi:hypothetical protein
MIRLYLPLGNTIFSFILAFNDSQRRWSGWEMQGTTECHRCLASQSQWTLARTTLLIIRVRYFSLPLTIICVIVSLLFDPQAHTLMQTETVATMELHLKNCQATFDARVPGASDLETQYEQLSEIIELHSRQAVHKTLETV